MRLPAALLRHTATVEPFQGHSGLGPVYGRPVTVACLVEDATRLGASAGAAGEGHTTTPDAVLYAQLDAPITVEAKVTVAGRATRVTRVHRREAGGLPVPEHLEVHLAWA